MADTTHVQLIQQIEKILDEWHQTNKESDLRKLIFDKLNKSRDDVLYKLMGFKPEYNNIWNIDHCNNRSGNSIAGDYLKATQGAVINEWLAQVAMPVLTEQMKHNLKASYQAEYQRVFQAKVKEFAAKQASDDAKEAVDLLAKGFPIDGYLQLKGLLEPAE